MAIVIFYQGFRALIMLAKEDASIGTVTTTCLPHAGKKGGGSQGRRKGRRRLGDERQRQGQQDGQVLLGWGGW